MKKELLLIILLIPHTTTFCSKENRDSFHEKFMKSVRKYNEQVEKENKILKAQLKQQKEIYQLHRETEKILKNHIEKFKRIEKKQKLKKKEILNWAHVIQLPNTLRFKQNKPGNNPGG